MFKTLEELIAVIRQRKGLSSENSYTSKLLSNQKLSIEKVKEETPEHKPTREMNTYDDLTDDGIMYGEPPLWQQALVSLGDLVRLRWPVLQIALYCSVAFALGYYLGFR